MDFIEGEQYRVVGEPKRHWGGNSTRLVGSCTPPFDAIVTVTTDGLDDDGDVRVKWDEGYGNEEGYILPENLVPMDDNTQQDADEEPDETAALRIYGIDPRRAAALGLAREALASTGGFAALSGAMPKASELIILADWLLDSPEVTEIVNGVGETVRTVVSA